MQHPAYCRDIEAYLCKKNEGHLIRVVGPSFELVSKWETDGIPIKVAFEGIDRYFERYYRKGPRRRPVRIDFCDADVRDVFDEWRRAVGAGAATKASAEGEVTLEASRRSGNSLPEHLERVVMALTNARATGVLPPAADVLIDDVVAELDRTRASAQGVRGEARKALIDRLGELDARLIQVARDKLDSGERKRLAEQAAQDLAELRTRMPPDAYARALQAAGDRLVREHFRLPVVTFE